MRGRSGPRWWWFTAGAALLLTLMAGSWWLLTKETRGAEIANVLALPLAILGLLAAVGAVMVAIRPARLEEKLAGEAQLASTSQAQAAGTARVKAAARGLVIAELDPLRLGVHPAIHSGRGPANENGQLGVLTPYLVRDHDHRLRTALRTGRNNQLLVLIGGSSVGKTRACYEAVAEVLPGWPVLHPLAAEELLGLLDDGVAPGTVLWLNETQRYLQPPHGRAVAMAVQGLLAQPAGTGTARVVVLGSMWPRYWRDFTQQPQDGDRDDHPEVRDLLSLPGVPIHAAEDFSEVTAEQLAELQQQAEQDPRLAAAIAAGGQTLRITQGLAGGPRLVKDYTHLSDTNPVAHAILTAAMDARRIGYESPLPAALLERAAPGYLTPTSRVTAGEWVSAALDQASAEIHGIRALTPIRTADDIGDPDAYVLHDYLAQHTLYCRRRDPIPRTLWDAVCAHAHDLGDLSRLTEQARSRLLIDIEEQMLHARADAGDDYAEGQLVHLLSRCGDDTALAELSTRLDLPLRHTNYRWQRIGEALNRRGGLVQAGWRARGHALDWYMGGRVVVVGLREDDASLDELRARANDGDEHAAYQLVELLVSRADDTALNELRARANDGDRHAERLLIVALVQRGDDIALGQLRTRVDVAHEHADEWIRVIHTDAGDQRAARQLAEALARRGDDNALDELRRELRTGNVHITRALLTLYADGDWTQRDLVRYGLDVDGFP